MANPQIPQGQLNRIRASVTFVDHPELNVTPSYLSRGQIRYRREGVATTIIGTATGTVPSPEPYQTVTIELDLLKTQSLAAQYEIQRKANTFLGKCTVRPDVTTGLSPFDVYNVAIMNPGDLVFDGSNPTYPITLGGYEIINADLWP